MAYSIAISVVKDEMEAKDVVQNAFIRVYKCLRSFRHDAKFSSWLYKIVVNEALKHLKKNKNKVLKASPLNESHEYQIIDSDSTKDLEVAERNNRIERVFLQMKPKEALVLKLFYLHEEPINRIIEITGFSKSNVKVLLHRARYSFSILFNQLND